MANTPTDNVHMEPNPAEELLSALTKLSETHTNDRFRLTAYAEDALYALYEIGMTNTKLTEEQKQITGPIIIQKLDAIAHCIENEIYRPNLSTFRFACIMRSGIQILHDDHKNYFEDSKQEEAAQILARFYNEDNLQTLTNTISYYCYPKLYEMDEATEEQTAKHKALNHHWWNQEDSKNNERTHYPEQQHMIS